MSEGNQTCKPTCFSCGYLTSPDGYGEYETITIDRDEYLLAIADQLDAAHKREITILRDALAEVVASIEVRFPAIEYAIDRKPYLDAKKILEQYKEETK